MKIKKSKILLLCTAPALLLAAMGTYTANNIIRKPREVRAETLTEKFDFVGWNFINAGDWNSDYETRTVEGANGTVTFSSANKQNSTITDCPVTRGREFYYELNDDKKSAYKITAVNCTLKKMGIQSTNCHIKHFSRQHIQIYFYKQQHFRDKCL